MKLSIYNRIILIALGTLLVASCGDDVPTDYKPENFVEAVLLVGEPIQGIAIIRTQPVNQKYNYYNSFIKDAEAVIIGDGVEIPLTFNFDTINPGYRAMDMTYLVKSKTEYKLEVKLSDGSILTGKTTTPGLTKWVKDPKDFVQYPKDTIKLTGRDTIAWEKVSGFNFYMIGVVCLDTLEYGKYLPNPTSEMNRRIYRPFGSDNRYKDVSQTAFVPNTETAVVWSTFKWFGKHEVVVYATDDNFTRWFIQNIGSNTVNPLLGSIEGGVGVFGSASVIRDTTVLLKNQP